MIATELNLYLERKAQYRESSLRWRRENRERYLAQHRLHQFNRKSLAKASSDGTVTTELLQELYSTETCAYCSGSIEIEQRTIDHAIPLSRGGPHSADNLVMACKSCNCSKSSKTPEEFTEWKQKHDQRRC